MKPFTFVLNLINMFGLSQWFSSHKEGVSVLSAEDYALAISNKKVQILDVRTPQEFTSGHLKGAVNLNVFDPDFVQKIERLDKEKPVYIYCQSGMRSRQAAGLLLKAGFVEVIDLKGGYSQWQRR